MRSAASAAAAVAATAAADVGGVERFQVYTSTLYATQDGCCDPC